MTNFKNNHIMVYVIQKIVGVIMKNNSVLLEIKSLEKMIFRSLINCDKEKVSNFISVPTPTQMQILEYILNHQEEEIYQKDL